MENNKTEEKRDNIVIPLENRRIFLPEKLDLYEEKKLRDVFNKIKDTIDDEYQKELDTRKTENMKIKQMKKIHKESDRVLVNTDKTKRIKIISTEEYYRAGEKFLGDEKQYRKLKTNHSIDIEKKANAIVKKIKPGTGMNIFDIEKLTMVGSKPANFFINLKDHKKKDETEITSYVP